MKPKPIILVGGGGHCKSVIDLIITTGLFKIGGIVDIKEKVGQEIMGIPIIASDQELDSLRKKYDFFAVTIGQIQSSALRKKFFDILLSIKAELPSIIAPTAHISSFALVGTGSMVFHKAIVNADAVIGNNCIINNMALVEHDTKIMDHCHISTAAVLNGNVNVGEGSFIGSNACVRQGVRIGSYAIIGAGSLVLKDVNPGEMVGGIPAQILRKHG